MQKMRSTIQISSFCEDTIFILQELTLKLGNAIEILYTQLN